MNSFIEPFTGSGAMFLYLLGTPPPYAPIGYAGNKRKVAPAFGRLIWPHSSPPDRVVLADVGPWRIVWEVFASGDGLEILATMRSWPSMPDRELWDYLVRLPPPEDLAEFAALYLYVQARQAHHAPIWLAPTWIRGGGSGGLSVASQRPDERWRVASGSCGILSAHGQSHAGTKWQRDTGQEPTHQDGRTWVRNNCTSSASHKTGEPETKGWRSGNPLSRTTLTRRLEQLLPLPWHRVTVLGDYREALTLAGPGDVVYADPPYRDAQVRYATSYPDDLEDQLLETVARGAIVAVSEGRLLPKLLEAGWWHADVTPLFGSARKPGSEQLMMSTAPAWTIPALAGGIQQEMF